MNVQEMHYDFKMKLNKVDSEQNKGFRVPEIDWLLNEAQELFVKRIMHPRRYNGIGFEVTQRSIDDLRTIVEYNREVLITNNIVTLPVDYWSFVSSYILATKGNCKDTKLRLFIRQHDDMFNESTFSKSSFEWREVNGTFSEVGITLHTEGDFQVNKAFLTYVRKLSYIHNAQGFQSGTYTRPTGEVLTGSNDSDLPDHTHREIVDLAVLIASGQLQTPNYQLHQAKANLNDLIN